ncbi:hypothetical protein CTAYLR_004734 [Chrysophaeum taylorii]|uniref:Sialidase domain-containing protein n=1 Tax=Chrysophaeum taylorii TaxID=2483200 RepID=A0AAD7U7N6_9STRA|nr:hypothetical protein CTAYLR_004734 [Chrysophaeum taylorii]
MLALLTPVFYSGVAPGRVCFRIPTILETRTGTLLAFAEDRSAGCSDDSTDHAIVVRRSEDGGETWGEVIEVYRGGSASNPNPVQANDSTVLLHFDTQNNPTDDSHGVDVEAVSRDDGRTWSAATTLKYPPLENTGGLVGPSVGLCDDRGGLFFSTRFDGRTNLYWSRDSGTTWTASSTSVEGVNECSLAFGGGNATTILANCRTSKGERAQVLWVPEDGDYHPSEVVYLDDLPDPGCQGSIVRSPAHPDTYYVSHDRDSHDRRDLVVSVSTDGGKTYPTSISVWPDAAGYSQLTTLFSFFKGGNDEALEFDTLGILFELDSDDVPGIPNASHSIAFATINLSTTLHRRHSSSSSSRERK